MKVFAMLLAVAPAPGMSPYSTIELDPYEEPGVVRRESKQEALERYQTVARAIQEASGGERWLAAALATVAVHESSLRRDVHECATLGDEGQSYTLFQGKFGRNSDKGWRLCGSDYPSTLAAARWAAGHLRRARRSCARDVGASSRCLFGRYGGLSISQASKHRGIAARAATYGRALGARMGS